MSTHYKCYGSWHVIHKMMRCLFSAGFVNIFSANFQVWVGIKNLIFDCEITFTEVNQSFIENAYVT